MLPDLLKGTVWIGNFFLSCSQTLALERILEGSYILLSVVWSTYKFSTRWRHKEVPFGDLTSVSSVIAWDIIFDPTRRGRTMERLRTQDNLVWVTPLPPNCPVVFLGGRLSPSKPAFLFIKWELDPQMFLNTWSCCCCYCSCFFFFNSTWPHINMQKLQYSHPLVSTEDQRTGSRNPREYQNPRMIKLPI